MRKLLLSKKIGIFLIVLAVLLVGVEYSFAQSPYTSVATGNWNSDATWSGTGIPGAGDVVIIDSGNTVSTNGNRTCAGISINGTLSMANNNVLTVNGDVSGTGIWTATSSSRNISLTGNWSFNPTAISSGTVTFTGSNAQTFTGSISSTGSGVLVINKSGNSATLGNDLTIGAFTLTNGTFDPDGFMLTISTTTMNINGGTIIVNSSTTGGNYSRIDTTPAIGSTIVYTNSTPTINASITYRNLTFSGTGTTANPTGNLIIQGDLSNTGGGALDFNARNVTLSGTVTANSIDGFTTTGTVAVTKTAGTATFNGNVNGGAISKSGSGTLDLGSGLTHTFTGNWTRSAGTINGNSSTLNIGGTVTNTGGTFIAGTSTVNYTGGTQTIANVAYNNLIFSGTLVKTIPSGTSVSGNLNIRPGGTGSATASIASGQTISVGSLTLDGNGAANGTWGSTTSTATYQNNTYFAATTGLLNVSTSTCPVQTDPTVNGATICIPGAAVTLSANGATSGQKYRWYNAATGGTLLKTSVNEADNTYTTPTILSTTDYWVSILSVWGCESNRVQVTATFPADSPDDQNLAGTNSWIGHVYDGQNFDTYYGTMTESEQFDENFGGDNVCFSINSSLGNRQVNTETFSVKYRMNSTSLKGLYVVDLGSDDKSRLTVDGSLVYNNWVDQGWTSKPRVLHSLTGSSSLLYEFTENGGQNRVVFSNLTQVLENNLSTNTTQIICLGSSGAAISGDVFPTIPGTAYAGLSNPEYQWAYSTNSFSGPWSDIPGEKSATYTPSFIAAPFNTAATYYFIRKAQVLSANNTGVTNYLATNESNVATITVGALPIAPTANNQSKTYTGSANTTAISATPGGGETIDWYDQLNGGSLLVAGSTSYTPEAINVGNYTYYAEARNTTTGCISNSRAAVTLTITVQTIAVSATAKSKIYGDADPSLTYTFAPALQSGDSFSGALTRGAGESVGNYAITQGTLSLSSNYTLSYTAANLTITTQTIAVTAAAKSKTYGDADPALTYTFAPALQSGDSFSGALTRGAGESVGNYAITQGTLSLSSNYTLSYTPANLTITAQTIAVTAAAKSKTYGDADPALTYTFAPALQSGDSFSGALTRGAGESVGNYAITQGTLSLSSNYTLSYTVANLTINQRSLTITANNQSKTYGSTFTFAGTEFTSSGLQNGETIGSVSLTSAGSPAVAAANTYSIVSSAATGGTFAAGNYTITYSDGTMTVGTKELTVTAENKSVTYGDAAPVLTYTMTGFSNGDTESTSVSGLPLLSTGYTSTTQVSSSPVLISVTTGTLASANYSFSFSDGSVTIDLKGLTIIANNRSKCFGDSDSFTGTEFTSSGLINGDTAISATLTSPGTNSGANPGTYTIVPSAAFGTGLTNYNINYTNGTYTVNTLPAPEITTD